MKEMRKRKARKEKEEKWGESGNGSAVGGGTLLRQ